MAHGLWRMVLRLPQRGSGVTSSSAGASSTWLVPLPTAQRWSSTTSTASLPPAQASGMVSGRFRKRRAQFVGPHATFTPTETSAPTAEPAPSATARAGATTWRGARTAERIDARATAPAAAPARGPAVALPASRPAVVPTGRLVSMKEFDAFTHTMSARPVTTPFFQLRLDAWPPGTHASEVTKYGTVLAVSHFRVGFMAPKKVIDKKAVVRNRAKRRLREAARTVMPISARHGYDYLFLAQPASLTVPFHELQDALRKVLADPRTYDPARRRWRGPRPGPPPPPTPPSSHPPRPHASRPPL